MEGLDSLVRAAQQGDAASFTRLVERFQDMAYASAYAMSGDRLLAQDAAQEAFLEAYLSLEKLREPAAFPRWFRTIVFKQVDRLTRGKRLAISPLEAATDLPGEEPDLTTQVERREVSAELVRALTTLSERERLVVLLFYGTGYSLKELATFLDVPVTTVKKRLYDARQHLKGELLDLLPDVFQGQRPSLTESLPAQVRLLLAARLGDLDTVQALLRDSPLLLNLPMASQDVRQRSGLLVPVGMTALHEATMHNHLTVAALLLEYGAPLNTRTSQGQTPLHGAVRFRCYATATLLLAHQANPNLPLTNGLTAFHLAAMHGDVEMGQLLLRYRAAIDCRSQHARTPCHWAALKGHVEFVRLLVAQEADLQARDCTGRTPYDWAISRGHAPVVALLQERTFRQ